MAPPRDESKYWRDFLNGQRIARVSQAMMHSLPRAPRCKLCQAPFAGWGGAVVGAFGYRPIPGNARICNWCFKSLANHPGGAEIELSVLFADLRGSTTIAERVGATAFGVLLNSFYDAVNASIDAADGVLDKYVGDGAIGLFFRGVSGDAHAARAIEAGKALLASTGGDIGGAAVGVGVHSGEAFVGVVGTAGGPLDFTAIGDTINTASRLASAAGAGELLVSAAAAGAASVPTEALEARHLEVRGREQPVDVWVLRQ